MMDRLTKEKRMKYAILILAAIVALCMGALILRASKLPPADTAVILIDPVPVPAPAQGVIAPPGATGEKK